MEAFITFQKHGDPPALADQLKEPIIDLTEIDRLIFCVCETGMQSGAPSVVIAVTDTEGSVVLQTSLDKFMMATTAMVNMAEMHFGWKQPEGMWSLPPMEPAARKMLLEAIKKELEEWENES